MEIFITVIEREWSQVLVVIAIVQGIILFLMAPVISQSG
ncbi:hypothetical protein NC651_003367 [Populus alba x Populus x berolinensis]|nr:hypothetical protein NC651_003367 [Populus alba x Populus x berolinensis]